MAIITTMNSSYTGSPALNKQFMTELFAHWALGSTNTIILISTSPRLLLIHAGSEAAKNLTQSKIDAIIAN
jgi:uncharacterized membrane protein YgcG